MDRVLGTCLQSVCLLDRKAKPALGTYTSRLNDNGFHRLAVSIYRSLPDTLFLSLLQPPNGFDQFLLVDWMMGISK